MKVCMSPDSHHKSWEVGRKKKRSTETEMKEKVPYRKGGVQTEKSSPSDRRVGLAYGLPLALS